MILITAIGERFDVDDKTVFSQQPDQFMMNIVDPFSPDNGPINGQWVNVTIKDQDTHVAYFSMESSTTLEIAQQKALNLLDEIKQAISKGQPVLDLSPRMDKTGVI